MKLNMDSVTYDNGNGGIEFLEKSLKLTKIRDFGRLTWLMTVHGDGFVCSRSLDVVGCCRKWQPSAACIPPNWAYSFAVPQGSVSGHYEITCSPRRNKRNQLIPLISARATRHCPLTLPRATTNK